MTKDDLVWEQLEEVSEEWEKSIHTSDTYRAIAKLILKYRDGKPKELHLGVKGGYNVVYRLEYADGSSAVLRMPIRGKTCAFRGYGYDEIIDCLVGVVQFPEEKVRYEAATMRYIAANTTIPVPHVYHCGTAGENPTGLGPFLIMEYIEHDKVMTQVMRDESQDIGETPILDPNISEDKLGFLYGQMANILLQLSRLKFPRIGSLVENEDGISAIARPLIQNMNDLVEFTGLPPSQLPCQTFDRAGKWYSVLADMHMNHLTFQHNDVIDDIDDARDKYVSRQLFRNIVAQRRLIPGTSKTEDDFRLWSEDLSPSNVLVDRDFKVVGVIDWEFAYAAPAQFTFDPPWWLILREPEWWSEGYGSFMEVYEPRLETFICALETEEKKATRLLPTGGDKAEPPLSQRMRESWKRRTWMVNYAARKSWAFDFIWWKYLDESYFGPNEDQDYKARLGLLSESQREAMEPYVSQKMKESEERRMVNWTDEEAAARLAEVLI